MLGVFTGPRRASPRTARLRSASTNSARAGAVEDPGVPAVRGSTGRPGAELFAGLVAITAPSTIAAVLLSDSAKADAAGLTHDGRLRRRHVNHGARSRPPSVLLLLGRCDRVAGEQLGADHVGDVG